MLHGEGVAVACGEDDRQIGPALPYDPGEVDAALSGHDDVAENHVEFASRFEQGERFGITPYGTETMHVLRAEKGFIIVGQETDGTTAPDDVGLSGLVAKAKGDFVGKRSLARPDLSPSGRKQLVGLLTENPAEILDEGAQLVADPAQAIPMRMLGHVTSSYWSETCGRSVALALVKDGRSRMGEELHATTLTGFAAVRVVEPVFVDAAGGCVHA